MSPMPTAPSHATSPTLTGIICTLGGRPQMLRDAIHAMASQDVQVPTEVLVVFDHVEPDPLSDVDVPAHVQLRTIVNDGPKGLAGGRNSGVRHARGTYVAFCDDDDAWAPSKTRVQLATFDRHPEASAVGGAIAIQTETSTVLRSAPRSAQFQDFLRSRITEIHPSAVMYRRDDLAQGGRIGPVDEELPHGYGEDYDLLLRAAQVGPVLSVEDTVLTVRWDRPSYFAGQWESMTQGLSYILRKFPQFESCPKGLARIAGQVAFAQAASGRRKDSVQWARAALYRDRVC